MSLLMIILDDFFAMVLLASDLIDMEGKSKWRLFFYGLLALLIIAATVAFYFHPLGQKL